MAKTEDAMGLKQQNQFESKQPKNSN